MKFDEKTDPNIVYVMTFDAVDAARKEVRKGQYRKMISQVYERFLFLRIICLERKSNDGEILSQTNQV